MLKEFLDGHKLSPALLEVVAPTNKVADANFDKGEASSDKVPLSSGRYGSDIFAHVEPPLTYGGPDPNGSSLLCSGVILGSVMLTPHSTSKDL